MQTERSYISTIYDSGKAWESKVHLLIVQPLGLRDLFRLGVQDVISCRRERSGCINKRQYGDRTFIIMDSGHLMERRLMDMDSNLLHSLVKFFFPSNGANVLKADGLDST